MPRHPLFHDSTIALSATLAATIGLHEAILLTLLNDAASLQSQPWARFNSQVLRSNLPFWDDATIKTVLQSLVDKGLVNIQGKQFPDTDTLFFNFNGQQLVPAPVTQAKVATPQQPWQPEQETLQRLQQHGIDPSFALAQLDAFMVQAKEQGSPVNELNSKFFRHVKKEWVYAQNRAAASNDRGQFLVNNNEATPMLNHWRPNQDAVEILERDNIDPQFIQDAIAEFILFWRERGEVHNTWNTKFVQHVRIQWQRFISVEEHGAKPMPISDQWYPSEDCFDIIKMAYIDRSFAEQLVREFVLYWRDSKQVHTSWNSRFLQYVKQRWGARLTHTGSSNGQTTAEQSYTTAQASAQRLVDTNWAK